MLTKLHAHDALTFFLPDTIVLVGVQTGLVIPMWAVSDCPPHRAVSVKNDPRSPFAVPTHTLEGASLCGTWDASAGLRKPNHPTVSRPHRS
jgi:hypothetical protein